MSGLFLFTGENRYQLQEEKLTWIREFTRKHGPENLMRLEGDKLTIRTLLDEVSVAPFIAEKRLVVVEGVPKCSKEDIQVLNAHIHPQVIVLVAAPVIDKRLAGTKELLNIADVREFLPLKGKGIERWVSESAKALGTPMDTDAMMLLLEFVGEDQDLLEQEIRKLSLYALSRGTAIKRDYVEEMAIESDEGIVWRITDLLSTGKKLQALAYARRMIERGGDAYGMWAVLLSMLRNVVDVSSAVQEGESDPRSIGQETGVHPFAVRSLLFYARKVPKNLLQRHVETTIEADIALKTGGYRATDEAPEELVALVDRFILTFP